MSIVHPSPDALKRAADALRAGALVAFPTETVYGLGADATNGRAVAAIFEAKGRPHFNPLIVHVPDLAAAERIAVVTRAARGLAGAPGIGAGNLYLEPGSMTPAELLAPIRQGLYVLETMGKGVDLVTGDFSQGVFGLWIENGELTHAVHEITIAGNLKEMYRNITAVANDLHFRSASAAPTLRIDGMMVAGA